MVILFLQAIVNTAKKNNDLQFTTFDFILEKHTEVLRTTHLQVLIYNDSFIRNVIVRNNSLVVGVSRRTSTAPRRF